MRMWLIQIREAKGYTQAYVARAVGVKPPTYWEYEHGDTTPTVPVARKLGLLLGFDPMLFWPEKKSGEPA